MTAHHYFFTSTQHTEKLSSFNFLQILPHHRHWHAYRQIESIVLKKSETKQNRGEDGKIVYGNWACVCMCATNIELGDALEFR